MTNAHDPRTLEERLEWIANWSEPDIDLADAGTAREALHALLERAEAIQILETRIAVLENQCERQAGELAALRNRPIVDQDGNEVGRAKTEPTVEAFCDDNGTVWTPPTAWAYYAVCKARDAHADNELKYRKTAGELAGAVETIAGRDDAGPPQGEHFGHLRTARPGESRSRAGRDRINHRRDRGVCSGSVHRTFTAQ